MKAIVITGSTRGLGLGMAQAFLDRGHAVTISGRTQAACEQALAKLRGSFASDRLLTRPCDVRDPFQVQALWDTAKAAFGQVDIWINNAGFSPPPLEIWKLPSEDARAVLETNLLGVIHGATTAARGMLAQESGAIYNMEGMGSDGRKHNGLAYYGTTKYAVHYYTECLVEELKNSPLVIGALRPGMVITDLVTTPYKDRPEEWRRVKRIFNIIADTVDNVTPWLADHILANQKSGVTLSYTSGLKIMGRFITSPFSKRDLFKDHTF